MNKSLISKQWVDESTSTQKVTNQGYHYGYLWWRGRIDTHHFYYASGNGG